MHGDPDSLDELFVTLGDDELHCAGGDGTKKGVEQCRRPPYEPLKTVRPVWGFSTRAIVFERILRSNQA